jgi:hypothetical protein
LLLVAGLVNGWTAAHQDSCSKTWKGGQPNQITGLEDTSLVQIQVEPAALRPAVARFRLTSANDQGQSSDAISVPASTSDQVTYANVLRPGAYLLIDAVDACGDVVATAKVPTGCLPETSPDQGGYSCPDLITAKLTLPDTTPLTCNSPSPSPSPSTMPSSQPSADSSPQPSASQPPVSSGGGGGTPATPQPSGATTVTGGRELSHEATWQ